MADLKKEFTDVHLFIKPDEFITLNARGREFKIPFKTMLEYPKSTRLGKLSQFKTMPTAEITELCDSFNKETNEFYFNRNPRVLSILLDYFLTDELHVDGNLCEVFLLNELKYWEVHFNEVKHCCKNDFERKLEEKNKLVGLEDKVIKDFEEYDLFNVTWMPKVRKKLWRIVEQPTSSKKAATYFIVTNLILLIWTCYTVVLSLPEYRNCVLEAHLNETYMCHIDMSAADMKLLFRVIDLLIFTFFLIELCFRFIICPNKIDFIKKILNIIDFLSILLFFIFFFLNLKEFSESYHYWQHFFMSFKIVSTFKITRLSWELGILLKTIQSSVTDLLVALFYLIVTLLIISNLIFYAEIKTGNKKDFQSIIGTFWWAIATMTTVIILVFPLFIVL